jgi:MoxR-like ATPase
LRGDNIIYFGPPGTGKSHQAELVAESSPETIHVLFHPEYTYNDFFGLYKPVVGADPKIDVLSHDGKECKKPIPYFAFVPGPLLLALANAFGNPYDPVYLIIDEINRGDCAAIFGDILQLLDRKPDGSSRYAISISAEAAAWLDSMEVEWHDRDGKLFFPTNFTILATMNTSDQGLYPMDSAFKRRWQWQSCGLSFQPVLEYLGKKRPILHDAILKWDWEKLVLQINSIWTDINKGTSIHWNGRRYPRISSAWRCMSWKTRRNDSMISWRFMKQRLCVPCTRVWCHKGSAALNSGE